MAHQDPWLPLDLIRDISDIAAVDNLESAKSLVLVAKRMQVWIDPILYRTVKLWSPESVLCFHQTLRDKSAPFDAKHVKLLFFENPTLQQSAEQKLACQEILERCTGLVELYGLTPFVLDETASRFTQLRRLELLDLGSRAPFVPVLSRSIYSTLTHLTIQPTTIFSGSPVFPERLTHLCLGWTTGEFVRLFSNQKHLKIVVFWYPRTIQEAAEINFERWSDGIRDSRFIALPAPIEMSKYADWASWSRGAGKPDIWTRADRIIKQRQVNGHTGENWWKLNEEEDHELD